jgi:hypothetical protein
MERTVILDWGFLRLERHIIKLSETIPGFRDDEFIVIYFNGKEVGSASKNRYGDNFNGVCQGKWPVPCQFGRGFCINFTNDGLIRDENLDVIPDDKLAEAFHCRYHGGATRALPMANLMNGNESLEEMRAIVQGNIALCDKQKAEHDKKMGQRPVIVDWEND